MGGYKTTNNFTAIFDGRFTVPAADMMGEC